MRRVRIVALSMLPMGGALAGACVDERLDFGYTIWRASCRASGFAVRSVMEFTLQLLPCAVIGALIGGLVVLALALRTRHAPRAHESLAAHAGCVLAMPVGLVLCALALPLPLMLAAEAAIAAAATLVVLRALDVPHRAARLHP